MENIESRYSDILLPDVESIHQRGKDASFSIMCNFLDIDINFPKCPCVC